MPVTVSLLSVPSTLAHPLPPSNTRAHFFAGVVVRPSLGVENSTLESGSRSAPCCPLQGPLRALAAHARDALVEIVKVAALQLAGELCTARGVLGLAIFKARSTNSCTVAGCDKLTMAASWAQSVFLRSWSFWGSNGEKDAKKHEARPCSCGARPCLLRSRQRRQGLQIYQTHHPCVIQDADREH